MFQKEEKSFLRKSTNINNFKNPIDGKICNKANTAKLLTVESRQWAYGWFKTQFSKLFYVIENFHNKMLKKSPPK